jgi:hypothetical protein
MRQIEYDDLYFSYEGDFAIENGDLKDTDGEIRLRSDTQEFRTIIQSAVNDWALEPFLGANLDEYVGEQNTRITADHIEAQIMRSISRDRTLDIEDVIVSVAPLSPEDILIRIDMFIDNEILDIRADETFSLTFIYDTQDKKLTAFR